MQLLIRVSARESIAQPITVRSIEHADKNPKKVATWITNIEEVCLLAAFLHSPFKFLTF